jgi:hypothetical protein
LATFYWSGRLEHDTCQIGTVFFEKPTEIREIIEAEAVDEPFRVFRYAGCCEA